MAIAAPRSGHDPLAVKIRKEALSEIWTHFTVNNLPPPERIRRSNNSNLGYGATSNQPPCTSVDMASADIARVRDAAQIFNDFASTAAASPREHHVAFGTK
jgi:hypothetical protein